MRFTSRDGYYILRGIAAFDTEHFCVAIMAQIAHLIGDLLPWVPDDCGVTAAFDDDDIPFESFVLDDAIIRCIEIDSVHFLLECYRTVLHFAFEIIGLIEIIGIIQTMQLYVSDVADFEVGV